MARIELVRPVAADPAGIALLVSGPVGSDLWSGGRVRFGPPQRSGLGFVSEVGLTGESATRGRLAIHAGHGGPGTAELSLVLQAEGQVPAGLGGEAHRFLSRLAALAEERASAA